MKVHGNHSWKFNPGGTLHHPLPPMAAGWGRGQTRHKSTSSEIHPILFSGPHVVLNASPPSGPGDEGQGGGNKKQGVNTVMSESFGTFSKFASC